MLVDGFLLKSFQKCFGYFLELDIHLNIEFNKIIEAFYKFGSRNKNLNRDGNFQVSEQLSLFKKIKPQIHVDLMASQGNSLLNACQNLKINRNHLQDYNLYMLALLLVALIFLGCYNCLSRIHDPLTIFFSLFYHLQTF